jgi:SAM-dependent methyltransferase
LHAAKTHGRYVPTVVVDLVAEHAPESGAGVIGDIGCGRGTTTLALAARFPGGRIVALDQSGPLLRALTTRAKDASPSILTVRADFHHLPLPGSGVDACVAAFCLYHSPRPERALAEIARVLTATGRAVLVTKSADSYQELDAVISGSGLDPDAGQRPGLYAAFHSANAPGLTRRSLRVVAIHHERHRFAFHSPEHLAAYLATTPRYRLPAEPTVLASRLRKATRTWPVAAASTVTYVVAARP